MSNPLRNIHPMRAAHWIETHCELNTPDGLLPEDQELQLWRMYLYDDPLTSV